MAEPLTEAPSNTVPAADPPAAPLHAVGQALPSVQLLRLKELAAAELTDSDVVAGGEPMLSEQAMADVLAAVDASTAGNTKKAFRSDWPRFTL